MGLGRTLRELDERVLPFRGSRAQGLARLAGVSAGIGVMLALGGTTAAALYAFALAAGAGVGAVVSR